MAVRIDPQSSARRSKLLLVIGLAAGTAVAVALGLATPHRPQAVYTSICPFKAVTGLPCPGCGMAHGIACSAVGRFSDAVAYNPFSPVALAGAIVSWLILLYDLLFSKRLWETVTAALRIPCLLLALLMLCWGAWRAVRTPRPTHTGGGTAHTAPAELRSHASSNRLGAHTRGC